MILLFCLLACPTPPVSPRVEIDADSDTDADADSDTDTDTDSDSDLDTGSSPTTAQTGILAPSPTADTGRFGVSCDTGGDGTLDCRGACYPTAYIGDGVFCDDGGIYPWGTPDFNCPSFAFDGGDCSSTGHTGNP